MEPVDPEEAPDYYKVIKEPMGILEIATIIEIVFKKVVSIFHRSQADGNQTRIKHLH